MFQTLKKQYYGGKDNRLSDALTQKDLFSFTVIARHPGSLPCRVSFLVIFLPLSPSHLNPSSARDYTDISEQNKCRVPVDTRGFTVSERTADSFTFLSLSTTDSSTRDLFASLSQDAGGRESKVAWLTEKKGRWWWWQARLNLLRVKDADFEIVPLNMSNIVGEDWV